MKFVSVTGTAGAFLFFGTMIPVYAQHEGQGDKPASKQEQGKAQQPQQQHAQQPQPQRAPQQRAPQQKQQAQQQTKPQAQPQQHAQQAKPQAQPQQHAQQAKPQLQPQQRAQQVTPQPQPQQHAQQAKPQPQQTQQARQQPQGRQPPQRTKQQARTWQQQKGWQQHGAWQAHSTWQQDRAQNWSSDHRTWAQRGGYGGYYIPQDSYNLYFGSQHFFRLGTLPVMYMGYPRFQYGGFSFLLVDPWPEGWSEDWYASDEVYIDYDDGYYLCDRRYPQVRLAITIEL